MKLPYLHLIGHRGHLKIYQVDGAYVRSHLDEEFTNFGQHYRFSCIPEYELWIEKEAAPDERRFFIDHLLVEWRLMRQGLPYATAIDFADAKERSERSRTRDFAKIINNAAIPDPSKVHLQRLAATSAGFTVWLVDGRLIRSVFNIDFTEGGHDLVYDFVPQNEIWLDNDLSSAERPFVLLHELFERSLMAKKLTYPQAHRRASRLEWFCRHHPKVLPHQLLLLGCPIDLLF